jgi:SAM-dependent methyltransferase
LTDYYERRAAEYDVTSWEHPESDAGVADRIRIVVTSLSAVSTLDIGCGTGYVSRWLSGPVTLLDASPAMLKIARSRLHGADSVQAVAPPLPFVDHAFGRAFSANLYGHLALSARSDLVSEMLRVADELVIIDQLSDDGSFSEGTEARQLIDGSIFAIHKCYFTIDRLLQELGGGEVLMAGPVFGVVRRRR